jgi:hypothetical protein
VYRAIGADTPPTLLVDEADTIFGGKNADANEDLRGLLNAGHQRNRPAIRWDAGTRTLEKIPTFAMAALAGIGAMPDTIEDRAVVIRMRRRAPGESVATFRYRDRPALTDLAASLTGWLAAHLPDLEHADPATPLEDRAADTWEPLIAIADLAGADWPALARAAAVVLTDDRDQAAAISDRIRLLTDCRAAFGTADALPTTNLIARLRSDPESPWSDHGPAGLTPMKLADLLRQYDIRSANIRFGEPIGQAKGYHRADFTDAWARYCPETQGEPSQPSQPSPPRSEAGRPETRDDLSRPTQTPVPGLTCDGTTGTTGTTTPRFDVINGGRA